MQQVTQRRGHLDQLALRLKMGISRQLTQRQQQVMQLEQNLQHLNPRAVLERGYAFVQTETGEIVQDSTALRQDQSLNLSFAKGEAQVRVTAIKS